MDRIATNDSILLIVGAILFFACIILYFVRSRRNRATSSFRKGKKGELEERLLNMVFGNKGTFDRLIAYEKNRNPGGTEEDYIQSAIERMMYDRR